MLVASCASSNTLRPPADGCSTLAATLAEPTPHATLGNSGDPALDWQLYGVAETGALNMANRDKADILAITRQCEDRDRRAWDRVTAPWWQFWR